MSDRVAKPFEFTISQLVQLRALVNERQSHLLGCDQTAKTISHLSDILLGLDKMQAHLALCNIEAASVSLRAIETLGFAGAARILKGADSAISNKDVFINNATLLLSSVKQAFKLELDFYKEIAGPKSVIKVLTS
jgi:hypothetical protein